jgi:hypothetical protein
MIPLDMFEQVACSDIIELHFIIEAVPGTECFTTNSGS